MEPSVILIILLVVGTPLALAIWLVVRAVSAGNRIEELSRRIQTLERELLRLRPEAEAVRRPPVVAPAAAASRTEARPPAPPPQPEPPAHIPAAVRPAPQPAPTPPVAPPPLAAPSRAMAMAQAVSAPQPPPMAPPTAKTEAPSQPPTAGVNWEQFMGVKLFAWLGGFALFLGVVFFVKYAFDRDLVSPELRVAIGFLIGLGLVVGGVVLSPRNYAVLGQTLCATGVVILYAVAFACRSIYHFPFFGVIPTFLLMVLITATAFVLAARFDALVVAILGMLGGFLTPVLIHSDVDNPLGLFGYIAILDTGLVLVALHRRWHFLAALAALGTIVMQIGWVDRFFVDGHYSEGNKILVALTVLLGFQVLYLLGVAWTRRRGRTNAWLSGSTLALAGVALGFTGWFLTFASLAQRPWLLFGFVFVLDLCVTVLVLLDPPFLAAQPLTGLAVFSLLALWTAQSLTNDLLNAALAAYLMLAAFHSIFPVLIERLRGIRAPVWAGQFFPPLALVLVLIPLFRLAEVSFIVWPFVFLVDALAVGLAALTASMGCILGVLLLTLAATGALILRIPATLTDVTVPFLLIGVFAVLFAVAGLWLVRRVRPAAFAGGVRLDENLFLPANLAAQLPIFSAVLPFLLLIMATLRLPLADPTPVFALALLLVVLLLGVSRLFQLDALSAVGLACVAALEGAWHYYRFTPAHAPQALVWYLVFYAIFAGYPFAFLQSFAGKTVPWAAAAVAGLPQFLLMHRLVAAAYPNPVMGLLPAAFAVPPLLGLVVVLKRIPATLPARMTQLAWFAGVALLFITLIFPIQFERQWITIGWGLEGAALLWLFHRVPHPGLRLAGAGLLVAAFVRLALNPAVLDYHPRSATPILNWYLYAYGIVTVCQFVGARLLAPPRNRVLRLNAPPLLAALGTVLAFWLLNIEIADYFSPPGSTLTFQFSGNFARDMTYSIAWALFALVLLVVGILRGLRASRYAALGLLSVALLKLFFHDLARLDQLYRIGAFIGVAIIAMLASFAYQRFFAATLKPAEPKHDASH
jgi:hypothetical protein